MTPADVRDKARPFWLGPERSERGVLLVHGFTGSPFEMRLLGEALAARGFTVHGPALAGHVGDSRKLAETRWPDWYETVERGYLALSARATRVAVCGLSLGGLLTLELARRLRGQAKEPRALALLSTALWLPRAVQRFDRLVERVHLGGIALPKIAGSDIADREMRRANRIAQGRAGMSLAALHSLIELGREMLPRLGEVTLPTLVAHARHDHTIPFACHQHLVGHLGAQAAGRLTELVLERSFHVITLDLERTQVENGVADHVMAHT
jgi:carboxylesterase